MDDLPSNSRKALAGLRYYAIKNLINITDVLELSSTPEGKAIYMKRMSKYTVMLPSAMVTYTLETHHPCGVIRHVAIAAETAANPFQTWLIAEELGFVGGLDNCAIWLEKLEHKRRSKPWIAVNVSQPLSLVDGGGTA